MSSTPHRCGGCGSQLRASGTFCRVCGFKDPVRPAVDQPLAVESPYDLHDHMASRMAAAIDASGSGVVPDKPALAPEPLPEGWTYETSVCVVAPCCGFTFAADHTDVPNGGYSCPVCVVPAVTDDEAAKKVLALEFHRSFCGSGTGCRVVDPQGTRCAGLDSEDFRAANGVLSGLRSAGFLIVHHTKETRTMRPVVPLDHWGEPVKETP